MAFGSFESGQDRPMAEINTTPLVDVMLVLLIIFMVCAPLMTQSIPVNLPKAASVPSEQKPDVVNLAITADGSLHWNGDAVGDDGLVQCLTELAQKTPQPELHLVADKDVRYERVAQVMALVRRRGVSKMGFVMLPGESASP